MTRDSKRVLLSWSSGKDSAWTLHELRERPEFEVVGMLTTFNETADRVAMHAVRRQLAEMQAASAGLPLIAVQLPWPCPNDVYERAIGRALDDASDTLNIETVAFGDLYLEDVRQYREQQMASLDITPIFPIWHLPTDELAVRMIDAGLRAIVTCVDPRQCPHEFCGRKFDHEFLRDLPDHVDPCGENGEFHTFAYAGPMFSEAIGVTLGDIVERDGFVFADLLPAGNH
ncbi:MAG: hypothetical protein R3192_06635 [Woeseiaceae bacterium]|nr:hypothetical protein [Woeseiaceae bacterium]